MSPGHEPPFGADLLERVLCGGSSAPESFALLHRPRSAIGPGSVEVVAGRVSTPETLGAMPPSQGPPGGSRAEGASERHDVIAVVPYRQIRERGYAHVDDQAPLIALEVGEHSAVPLHEVLSRIDDTGIEMTRGGFTTSDAEYAETARRVISGEIGRGEGANFVLKRSYTADIAGYTPRSALTLFRRLLEQETGAYWTFLVHTPLGTFVGASPERHVSLRSGTAVMNPISGTYRYPASGPDLAGVLDFLADRKETDELYMVVDEELKMMARICDSAPGLLGPRLKEMTRLAHTEYIIEGRCRRDPREVLRETMFAPTVTGSPLESACRVIARHEPEGRGHYSGAVAAIGRDTSGAPTLDSAILIRTADISPAGRVRIDVGATLVRHSDPAAEIEETRAKAAGLVSALEADRPRALGDHDAVRTALARRNDGVSGFWLGTERRTAEPRLASLDVLVVDVEDSFTHMLAHQMRALGPEVEVRPWDDTGPLDGRGLVVLGPGPGDPRDASQPRIAAVAASVRELLAARRPFLAVCLSHQVLSLELGLELIRREAPNQGAQHAVTLFDHREHVGFYNTFAAVCHEDKIDSTRPGHGPVEISRDPDSGEVHALRGPGFASLQFHPESLLTRRGCDLLTRTVSHLLAR